MSLSLVGHTLGRSRRFQHCESHSDETTGCAVDLWIAALQRSKASTARAAPQGPQRRCRACTLRFRISFHSRSESTPSRRDRFVSRAISLGTSRSELVSRRSSPTRPHVTAIDGEPLTSIASIQLGVRHPREVRSPSIGGRRVYVGSYAAPTWVSSAAPTWVSSAAPTWVSPLLRRAHVGFLRRTPRPRGFPPPRPRGFPPPCPHRFWPLPRIS
jgi:hypothetical protein